MIQESVTGKRQSSGCHGTEPSSSSDTVKVLQVGKFYEPFVGGMETILKNLCEALHPEVRSHVLVANTRYCTEHEQRAGIPVTRVASLGNLFSSSLTASLPYWVRKIPADIVHVHLPNPVAELSCLMRKKETPLLAHFHSDIVRQAKLLKLYRPLLKAFFRRADCIVVPTPNHIDVSRFLDPHRRKCRIVPYGIRLHSFDLNDRQYGKVAALRNDMPAVLFVGRLVYYKGVEFLIRAMTGVRAQLWIIGSGPLELSLRDLAVKLGIQDRVHFLGEVSSAELVCRYHACDLFVLPSVANSEMFGMVQLEAMACRKPVISTKLPTGVSWVNQQGVTGLLVPPGDVRSLAQAIRTLIESASMRQEMGEAGRARVEARFTSDKMAAGIRAVYAELRA